MRIRNIFAIAAAVFLMSAAEASAELIFEENFESPDWAEKWTGSGVISDKASLSGEKALFWDAMNTMYEDSGKTAGNYVYEMWIYDTVADVGMNNGGCMMFGAMYEKGGYAHIGFKSNAWNGQYLYGNKIDGEDIQTTDVRRSPGWHQFIVDMTEPKNAKFYVDGVLVKQKGIAAPENIKGLFIRNPWNAGGGYHIDDVRVWENIDEVPKYKNAEFAEGDTTSVKIAEPEFAVNFKEAMNTETFEENIELKDKSGNMVELEITKLNIFLL